MVRTPRQSPDDLDADADRDPVIGGQGVDLGPLPRLTGYALRRAQLAVFDDFLATLAELDLRPAQYSVLLVVERNPGSTQTAVAAALGIQRANFVALIDGLENRGLARRAPSPNDRRSHALLLTPSGAKFLQQMMPSLDQHEAELARGLSADERAQLIRLLGRVSAP